MSQENVDVVRRTFDAIGRWDTDELLALYDPEIEFLPLTGTRVESGGYSGHDGVREYFEEVGEIWDELRPRADDVRTVGEQRRRCSAGARCAAEAAARCPIARWRGCSPCATGRSPATTATRRERRRSRRSG